jgi:hypothetical protein
MIPIAQLNLCHAQPSLLMVANPQREPKFLLMQTFDAVFQASVWPCMKGNDACQRPAQCTVLTLRPTYGRNGGSEYLSAATMGPGFERGLVRADLYAQ